MFSLIIYFSTASLSLPDQRQIRNRTHMCYHVHLASPNGSRRPQHRRNLHTSLRFWRQPLPHTTATAAIIFTAPTNARDPTAGYNDPF
ncbi:hypothetical protein HanRHA438_Chr17g0822441 [Helianthus annuus]|nr:hypothetical protein HanHA89_Chr17g0714381 [Helianthus annuus]KAJ0633115.1 hypothetical protein HanLR1_Chr17g0672901 [Helianthus annuus]KAJ0827155.1 hypothetical protein HanRHA438_Chr17g0822441 [Helianthus annuus]